MAVDSDDDEGEMLDQLRDALSKQRGYADFFGWPDRDIAELGVLESLAESLEQDGSVFFDDVRLRGRGHDPPDLEAKAVDGSRLAIEITELVDGNAISAVRKGEVWAYADWPRDRFLSRIGELLRAKDQRFPHLKGAPYPGGYVVVIHTDEGTLPPETVAQFLQGQTFGIHHITRALLVLGYAPSVKRCPYFELPLADAAKAASTLAG